MAPIDGSQVLGERLPASRQYQLKIYDFRRPDKFSKDQIRAVAVMHETFARLATAALSAELRAVAHIHVQLVDQLTYEEFIRSIPNPTMLAPIAMDPLPGSAVLEIDPAVTYAMIDRSFGGRGVGAGITREITDIEQHVISELVGRLLEALKESWSVVVGLSPRLANIETNPVFAQIVAPKEMVVLVGLEARVGESEGMINLCIPYLTIEPLIGKLSVAGWYGPVRQRPGSPRAAAAELTIDAQLYYEGDRLSLRDLAGLRRGSLVGMPGFADGTAYLASGGADLFKLRARRERGGRGQSFVLVEPGGLAGLAGAGPPAPAAPADEMARALTDGLRSVSAELGARLQSIDDRVSALARRQEELSDQLAFESPEAELSAGEVRGGRAPGTRPFASFSIGDCEPLAAFLAQEHPQAIAMVLSSLEPALAACLLERVPAELQVEVTERICSIEGVAPRTAAMVDQLLRQKLSAKGVHDRLETGGVGVVAGILNVASRALEKHVVESLEQHRPALAEEVKKRMFVFEDLTLLDPASVGRLLREVAAEDLVLALKTVGEDVRRFVWACMSGGEAEALRARLEGLGRTRLSDVEAAQQRIVAAIRRMEEAGSIVVARPDEVVE